MITAGKVDGIINLPGKQIIPAKTASDKKIEGGKSISRLQENDTIASSASTGALLDIALRYAIFELKLVSQEEQTKEEIWTKMKASFEEPDFTKEDKKQLEKLLELARVALNKADRKAQDAVSAVNLAVNVTGKMSVAEGAITDAKKALNMAAESVMLLECCVRQ